MDKSKPRPPGGGSAGGGAGSAKIWPIKVTMPDDGGNPAEFEIDRTKSHPVSDLANLISRKAKKSWRLMCLVPTADESAVGAFWIRRVAEKNPPPDSD